MAFNVISWSLVWAAAVFMSSKAAVLNVTFSEVEIGKTKNISLRCLNYPPAYDSNGIARMRILKRYQSKWKSAAEVIEYNEEVRTEIQNIRADGNITSGGDSFLQITWQVADRDTVGEYRCDIISFSPNEEVVYQKSLPIYIARKHDVTLRDLSIAVEENRECLEQNQAGLEDVVTKVKAVEESVQTKLNAVERKLQSLMGLYLEHWPEGTYALLRATNPYCPANIGVEWKYGYRRFHTESTSRNRDNVSEPNHFFNGMDRSGRDNYMYQYFCTVSTRSAGPLWPAGSYCINRKGDCPENFETGSQSTTCETTKSKSNSGGDFPSGSYSSSGQTMGFCCREDGNASIPVHLPTQKPFYLYRFGGKCQQVDGMVVLEESMTLHCHVTGHENVVPDGGRDGSPIYRVELCYYYRA